MLEHKRVDVVVSDYNVLRYLNSNSSVVVKPIALTTFSPIFLTFDKKFEQNKLNTNFFKIYPRDKKERKIK